MLSNTDLLNMHMQINLKLNLAIQYNKLNTLDWWSPYLVWVGCTLIHCQTVDDHSRVGRWTHFWVPYSSRWQEWHLQQSAWLCWWFHLVRRGLRILPIWDQQADYHLADNNTAVLNPCGSCVWSSYLLTQSYTGLQDVNAVTWSEHSNTE